MSVAHESFTTTSVHGEVLEIDAQKDFLSLALNSGDVKSRQTKLGVRDSIVSLGCGINISGDFDATIFVKGAQPFQCLPFENVKRISMGPSGGGVFNSRLMIL